MVHTESGAPRTPAGITILMPALNEEAHVEAAVRSLLPAPGTTAGPVELIVLDGGSSDRTREIVSDLAAADPRIRLVTNEKRIQSAAVNLGARVADPRSRHLVRADCHAHYPPGFAAACVATLRREGAVSVVVPMRTIGQGCMQKAIAAAQNSRFGNGGSRHRVAGRSGFVEHGHHAAFDRAVFLSAGGYDETFSHNEDAELDLRLVRAGHGIYLDAAQTIEYFPRRTLGALARQYFNFGWGRANTVLKHRVVPRPRQIAPVMVVLALALSLAFAPLAPAALAVPAAYLGLLCAFGVATAIRQRDACLAAAGPACAVMHVAWGLGFLKRTLLPPARPRQDDAVATPARPR